MLSINVLAGLGVVHGSDSNSDDGFSSLVDGSFALLVELAAPTLLDLRVRPALLADALVTVFLVPTAISRGGDVHVGRERTFFGVYRVVDAAWSSLLLPRVNVARRPVAAGRRLDRQPWHLLRDRHAVLRAVLEPHAMPLVTRHWARGDR